MSELYYRHQFALLKSPVEAEGWEAIPLGGGWFLSHDKSLPVACGPHGCLIGYAWSLYEGAKTPAEQMKSLPAEDLVLAMDTWCGRFAAVIGPRVYTDAGSCLGIFVSPQGAASDLRFLSGGELPSWRPGKVMNWFPCPGEILPGIRRLMPSQCFDLTRGETVYRGLRLPRQHFASPEARAEAFTELFSSSLKNMRDLFADKQLLVALTGGYDSRAILACLSHAGIPADCVTLEHDHMSPEDVQLPPQLAKAAGAGFYYYRRDESHLKPGRREEYLSFLANMQEEEDITFYIYGQYEDVKADYGKDIVLLRGSLWGIAKEYERKYHRDPRGRDVLDRYELRKGDAAYQAFTEYFAYLEEYPEEMSPAARFYWDQRSCGWGGENEHGFDLYEGIYSMNPVNNRILLSMLLDFPEDWRRGKKHQQAIISYACPAMADIPFSLPGAVRQGKGKVLAEKGGKLLRRLVRIGPVRTLRFYRAMAKGG